MSTSIDLNCDLGELEDGGALDAELMPLVTSANIACGGHAGDAESMRRTVRLAIEHGVQIGAHPSFPDRERFGRVTLDASPADIKAFVDAQLRALDAIVQSEGACLAHVKPHGALYNLASRDRRVATAIAEAVRDNSPRLALVGQAGSELVRAGLMLGLSTWPEAFADRAYEPDGSLASRSEAGAVFTDPADAAEQAIELVKHRMTTTRTGGSVSIRASTLCLHGDTPHAVAIAREVRSSLENRKVHLQPPLRLVAIDARMQSILEQSERDTFTYAYAARLDDDLLPLVQQVVTQCNVMLAAAPRPAPWGCYLAVDPNVNVVGTCAFKFGPNENGQVEIAYSTFPPFEGRGFATQMAAALVAQAVSFEEVHTVVAHTLPERNASCAVLTKNGFPHVGETIDPHDAPVWRWELPLR